MRPHPSGFSLAAVALAVLAGGPAARAGECLRAARAEYEDCKAECQEAFQVAKDACANRDHECVEACRAYREDCRTATGIDAALTACDEQLQSDRQACRDQFPPRSPERDHCIDQAQIIAFQCRDVARESARPALKQCRREFRHCVHECPRGRGPLIDKKQCRREAKDAYRACRAGCKEDFQVAKDACRNRDHECVEACREGRHGCRAPILEQLDAVVAACNQARDAAVALCKSLYPEGDPLRDQCIDNAQVAAFVCRDEAREAARPGLHQCRVDFRECVRACPPASPSGAFLGAGRALVG